MTKTKNVVYVAMYNPMIHESTFGIISIHRTRRGAEMAMEFHKAEKKRKYDAFIAERKETAVNYEPTQFGHFEAWNISEYEMNQ